MTQYRSNFAQFENVESQVQVGNIKLVKIEGIGKVGTKTALFGSAHVVTLTKVLYAPYLLYNLFSIRRIRKNGLRVIIEDDANDNSKRLMKLMDINGNIIKLVGPETERGLYYSSRVGTKNSTESALINSGKLEQLWHIIIGQFSTKLLK